MAHLISEGGWVMYLIMGCSVVALAFIIERSWYYFFSRRAYPDFLRSLKEFLRVNNVREAMDYAAKEGRSIGRIALAYLRHLQEERPKLEAVVHQVASQEIKKHERNLSVLSMIAHITPLMGLFGTVLGMIQCFQKIEALGGNANAQALAGGIWVALLTTAFGLLIAIPLIAVHHFFQTIVDNRVDEIEDLIHELDLLYNHTEQQSAKEKQDTYYEAI